MPNEDSDDKILLIDQECLLSQQVMSRIYSDLTRDYYASLDWTVQFYVLQAVRGFIAVGHETEGGNQIILPEIQKSYCVLDWARLHACNRSMIKSIKGSEFRLQINHRPSILVRRMVEYHGTKNWLCSQYRQLCSKLFQAGTLEISGLHAIPTKFTLCSVELINESGDLVAGELGYVIGAVYTSLSGFCVREKKRSIGKMQVVSLARRLEQCGFYFLNLGQPPMGPVMKYKADVGGFVLERPDFLSKWNQAISAVCNLEAFLGTDVPITQLF